MKAASRSRVGNCLLERAHEQLRNKQSETDSGNCKIDDEICITRMRVSSSAQYIQGHKARKVRVALRDSSPHCLRIMCPSTPFPRASLTTRVLFRRHEYR